MREKLHAAHPNKSGLFDLKHDRGGMIDIEFTVQFLVLAHAHRHAELTRNLGNIALLGMAAGLGLIPADARRRLPQRLPQIPAPAARAAAERRAVCARAARAGGGEIRGGAQPVEGGVFRPPVGQRSAQRASMRAQRARGPRTCGFSLSTSAFTWSRLRS